MARFSSLFTALAALCLASSTSATPTKHTSSSAPAPTINAPPPPSKDPFYRAPPNFAAAAPGTVLRVRAAPSLAAAVANCSAAYAVLYRTTDSTYAPSWAVTTIFVPRVPASPPALLSYQIPYDTVDLDASPSHAFYTSPLDPSIAAALGYGWHVTSPDYEGPQASFTAGVQSGHATLDSVRAALGLAQAGLGPATRSALWGYSGGALAGEWAAELQPAYAPELRIAGAALGGLTPNVSSVAVSVNRGPWAELIPNGLLGIASQDRAAEKELLAQLKPSGPRNASTFLSARAIDTTTNPQVFAGQNIFDYFRDGAAVLRGASLRAVLDRDGVMGYHGVPQMPVFAYKAIADEVSVVADTDVLVDRYCGVGANILYQRNTVGGHIAESVNGAPAAVAFLAAVLDGSYAAKYQARGCTIQNVTVGTDTSPE